MKQHPIPQNILDVEFKLFTKFTVREFSYIALGIGGGGIFLYLFTRGDLPGIIAIPLFIVLAGLGLFFGLVPINEQSADVFIRNYVLAITSPTQRVWKSKDFDEKVETIAEIRSGKTTQGTMQRGQSEKQESTQIIGGSSKAQETQFAEPDTIEELNKIEEERLNQINQALSDLQGNQITAGAGTQPPASQQQFTQQNTGTSEVQQQVSQQVPQQQEVLQQTPQQQIPQQVYSQEQPQQPQQQPQQQVPQQPQQQVAPQIIISSQNIQDYNSQITNIQINPKSINLYIVNNANQPITNAIVTIRDSQGKPIIALQTDNNGLFLTNLSLEPTEYFAKIEHTEYNFPEVRFLLEGQDLPIIKISSL